MWPLDEVGIYGTVCPAWYSGGYAYVMSCYSPSGHNW